MASTRLDDGRSGEVFFEATNAFKALTPLWDWTSGIAMGGAGPTTMQANLVGSHMNIRFDMFKTLARRVWSIVDFPVLLEALHSKQTTGNVPIQSCFSSIFDH